MLRKLIKFIIPLLVIGCSDEAAQIGETDAPYRAVIVDLLFPDVRVVDLTDFVIDAWVNPCENITNVDENYCDCNPSCCQRQTWYCPPTGTEVQAKYAILDICGEDLVPCNRNIDSNCPPAEIIQETACQHAFDCPPGINEDFTMYYDCEIDGIPGRQEVRCDKGRLHYAECVTCVEREEVCDNQDNDCDGEIDENQLNACGGCGSVPEDICDGFDNDCDGTPDEQLIRECLTSCGSGLEVCTLGNWIGCTARRPTNEECDGLDNDCDQLVDEGLNCQCPAEMVGALIPCSEPPLTCGMGFKTCDCVDGSCQVTEMTECMALCSWVQQVGEEECDPTLGMPIQPELCNDFDEDCDSQIDEMLVRECYTGPEGTLNVGVCQPGTQYCNRGQWYGRTGSGNHIVDVCGDEYLPQVEICNGADDDCDGEVDFGEEIPETDILFIIDWSGSMENYINAVRMAMSRFAQSFRAEDKIRWGLVVGPKIIPGVTDQWGTPHEGLYLETDIAEFNDFLFALSNVGEFSDLTGSEMIRDAMLLAVRTISGNIEYDFQTSVWANKVNSTPELQDFSVSWTPGADRIIVVFTDEHDQSFLVPRVSSGVLLDALTATPNLKTYIFTSYQTAWRNYATNTGGRLFYLSTNQVQMYEDLMSILDEVCLSGGEQASVREIERYLPVSTQPRYDHIMGLCY